MRILFVLPQIPWPPESGGRIVTSNTVRRFTRSHDVYVVCLYHHPNELEHLDTVKSWCREAVAFPAHRKWDVPVLLRSCLSRKPYKALRFLNTEMQGYISRLIKREKIDIVHCQNFYTAAYIEGDEPCLKIHYKENIEGLLLKRYAETLNNPIIRRMGQFEAKRTLNYELSSTAKFDRILSISPIDTAHIREMRPNLPITYQRAGVDLDSYPVLDEPGGAPTILFTGMMSYHPNYNGVLRFINEGWSLVRSAIPDARLLVVGHSPPDKLRRWNGIDGISVTGSVPDMGVYFSQAHVYLVPLWVGGGIRLKILEAMASGKAVVSTPIGCEGLKVEDGIHLTIGNEPSDLSHGIIRVFEDLALRRHFTQNARHLIEREYNWDAVIAAQEQNYIHWLNEHQLRFCL